MASYDSKASTPAGERASANASAGNISAEQNTQTEIVQQKPTNAKLIEYMNEAQIDLEIRAAQRTIANADKIMGSNDITQTADAIAMRESFPLGVGGSGWTPERRRQFDRQRERDSVMAKKYTDAFGRKQTAQARLETLQKAKNQISGTGKTLSQVREERRKAAESSVNKSAWKSSKIGNTRIYESASGAKISHSPGGFFILNAGGRQLFFDKLKTAQAAAERFS